MQYGVLCSAVTLPVHLLFCLKFVPSFFFSSYLHHKTNILHFKSLALVTRGTSDRLVQEYSLMWNFGALLPAVYERKTLRHQQRLWRFTSKEIEAHCVFLDMLDGVFNNDIDDCWERSASAIYRILQWMFLLKDRKHPAVITTSFAASYTNTLFLLHRCDIRFYFKKNIRKISIRNSYVKLSSSTEGILLFEKTIYFSCKSSVTGSLFTCKNVIMTPMSMKKK